MLNQKDIIAQNIKIQSNKEVSIINNDDDEEDYIYSALTVEGGGVFKKGIAIGIQEKMISGLIIYDNENFYGFSEKYGLSLLSPHSEYSELDIPNNIFENKSDNKLQPVQNNGDNFQNLKDTETNKSLNIDLQIKDVNNFYIIIPKEYSTTKSTLTFYIKYIYDLDSIISNISLVFINESNKSAFFEITNDNCYYENDFNKELYKDSVNKIYTDVINNDYFIINKKSFFKHS
jgi:hypothetical protein